MRRRRAARALVVAAFVIAALAIVRPWTVRPIDTASAHTFDATRYVSGMWPARVLSEAATSAVPLATVLVPGAAAPRRSFFVTGRASIASVDTRSRVGLARLAMAGATHPVSIQIGPVLRGTALRDALPFVHFSDFDNQLQFAEVADALNDAVLGTILSAVDPATLTGRTVAFTGAATMDGPESASDAPIEIVPVALDVTGGSRGAQ